VAVGVNVALAVRVNVAVAVVVKVAVAVAVAVAVGVSVAVAVGVNVAVAVGVNVAVAVGVGVSVAVAVGVNVAVAVGVNVAVAVGVGVSVAVAVGVNVAVAVGVNVAVAVGVGVSVAVAVAVAVGVSVAVAVAVAVGVGVGAVAVVEAENENTPLADGFWVENFHVPGVGSKPLPIIVPVPLTLRNPLPCEIMVDVVRSNVNPPTLQRAGSPEPKVQGAVIVTEAPTLTNVTKSPDRLTTVGNAPLPLSHDVTWVAVLTEPVLRCAPPLIVRVPVMGAACGVTTARSWEDSPVAVAWNVAPLKSEERMYQLVWKLQFASATTVQGWKDCWLGFVSTTIMSTVSPGWKPVPCI